MTRYAIIKKDKKILKIYVSEFINNSTFEEIVVEEIAKAIDEGIVEKIKIENVKGLEEIKNVNNN